MVIGPRIVFMAVFASAACAFASTILPNVHWEQYFPYNSYFLQTEARPNGWTGGVDTEGRFPVGCVQTAYAQLVAYHEWPAIIDDEYEAYAGVFSGTYVYRAHTQVSGHAPIDWARIKNGDTSDEAYNFEVGRLHALVTSFAYPVYSADGTASTVSCPHYNPWYDANVTHVANPAAPGAERDSLFGTIKASLDAGLPVAAGFQSSQGPHAVVLEGYRETAGTTSFWANVGWGAGRDVWSDYASSPAVGKNNAITGAFPFHAPRRMVQIAPVGAVSAPAPTISWFAPKYWRDRISGFQIDLARVEEAPVTWTDDFASLASRFPTTIMCSGNESSATDEEPHPRRVFVVEDGELKCWRPSDVRFYEWPETFVSTESTQLHFEALVSYTENTHAQIQIKVANQPWRLLHDLNADGRYDWSSNETWQSHALGIGAIARGLPFKLRIYLGRIGRSGYDHYCWRFRNWRLENVRRFASWKSVSAPGSARSLRLDDLAEPGTYEISVAPVIDGVAGDCFRTVATTVRSASVPAPPTLAVTQQGKEPRDGIFFQCGYRTGAEFKVSSSRRLARLEAMSGNLAAYPASAIEVSRQDDLTWTVRLTPTEEFLANPARADGQRIMLMLVGEDADGTAVYRDLSLEFCSKADARAPAEGGVFAEGDFYLPASVDGEWLLTIDDAFGSALWNDLVFTRGEESRRGSELPSDARVRVQVAATRTYTGWPGYRRVLFDDNRSLAALSVVSVDGGDQPLGFGMSGGVFSLSPTQLNVQGVEIKLDRSLAPMRLWIGFEGRVTTPAVFLDRCDTLLGVGTLALTQADSLSIADRMDLSEFKGYVTGVETITPSVEPTPDKIGTGAGGGSQSGGTVDTNPLDPIASIVRTYGYDMTEDYWDARKQAIQKGRMLFVLSGSTSCNWCHEAMKYLQRLAKTIDPRFVVYYAKRQNGAVPMQGGLPQYGSYDPRTIDAFTGTVDADGVFNPAAAWYSGCDNAFASERGFGETKIDAVIAAAGGRTIASFTGFTLEGPDAVFSGTPTKFHLYAHFADGVKMEVDHGLEWRVEGDASVDAEGNVTVRSGQATLSCRNAFYNFGADENTVSRPLSVVDASRVAELRLVRGTYNLEDDPVVRLRAEAVLADGSTTTAYPVWTVRLKEFLPLPDDAPVFERTNGAVTLDPRENGLVHYSRDGYDGIDLQDHVLHVTATLGERRIETDVTVHGPTRVWPTKWEIVTGPDVAPGSVIRTRVEELKYLYGGQVHTTTDISFASIQTGYVQNYTGYYISDSMAVDVPPGTDVRSVGSLAVRVAARKKGGKYSEYDYDWRHPSVSERTVTIHPAGSDLTVGGIRLNTSWLRIHFPGHNDFAALAAEDSDGDGFSNAEEFLLGTDPTDAADRWRFTSSHFDWPAEVYYRVMFMDHQFPGRIYTVEGAPDPSGPWTVLGRANGQLAGRIDEEDVAAADASRVFRVTVSFSNEDYSTGAFTIPGYGVWTDVTLSPRPGERYAAFVVDANDLSYMIPVAFSPAQNLSAPVFSVPTEQVMPGTLARFEPTADLRAAGWRFSRMENGIWTDFHAERVGPVRPRSIVGRTDFTEAQAALASELMPDVQDGDDVTFAMTAVDSASLEVAVHLSHPLRRGRLVLEGADGLDGTWRELMSKPADGRTDHVLRLDSASCACRFFRAVLRP